VAELYTAYTAVPTPAALIRARETKALDLAAVIRIDAAFSPAEQDWTVDDIVSAGPGTYESPEALVARIPEVSGFTPTSPTAISGHISRRGRYTRESPDGTLAIVSGSPLLDGIASPAGEVVVGGQVVQPPSIGPTRAAATVCQPGPYEGLETCFSKDGTTLEIRSWDGSFARFHSWKESGIGHWSLGTSITVRGPHFQRAAIDARYYFPAFAQTCNVIYDNDHDANDSYMAESEEGWGFNADSARRVESLCRIQWNGYRLRGIVSAGESCLHVSSVREFTAEYPDDWPAIEPPPSLIISPTRLEFTSRATSPCGLPEVCIPCDLRRRLGQLGGIMVIRVPAPALSHLRPALRLAGPAQPVIGL
jgi:hypothetical protein